MHPLPDRHVALLLPSTNTVAGPEISRLLGRVACVHTVRADLEGAVKLDDEDSFAAMMRHIDASLDDALRSLPALGAEQLIFAISARSFYGGLEGERRFHERLTAAAGGIRSWTAAGVVRDALEQLGATRIGLLTPYAGAAAELEGWLDDHGWQLAATQVLGMRDPTEMAGFGSSVLIAALEQLAEQQVDAIVQVGTNLRMAHLAGEASRWLGVPVLAVNALLAWRVAQGLGVATDQVASALPPALASRTGR